MKLVKSYDRFGALRFPLMPGTQETAWRYIFDWSIAGETLKCAPGDLVLEFGSGPCYASEWLNRLGYCTVSLDIESEVLSFAHERMTLDIRVEPCRANFVAGDGQCLPFANATFDGVICLNALHHIPNYGAALSEIRRILKPGCRAVFSEPGKRHADAPESKQAREQYGAVEKNIVLDEIHKLACRAGFEQMLLKPCVYPQSVELDFRHLDSYRSNLTDLPHTRPNHIADFMEQVHSIFALVAPGQRPVTSARPSYLRADLLVGEFPAEAEPGQTIPVQIVVKNTGNTLWLCRPRDLGGYVTLGVKLCRLDRRVLSDTLGRTLLKQDVPPGSHIVVETTIQLPEVMEPDEYMLLFDMVDERIVWFEQTGSPVIERRIIVQSHNRMT